MMNEFVYCQRLFYYEFVEGVFVESVDTLRTHRHLVTYVMSLHAIVARARALPLPEVTQRCFAEWSV